MRTLLLFLLLLHSCLALAVNENTRYETERAKLLALPDSEQWDALKSATVFDRSTALGRYFYLSVAINISVEHYAPLSARDAEALKANHLMYYYEYDVLRLWFDPIDTEATLSRLAFIRDDALSHGWLRIARWATSIEVGMQIITGKYHSAILSMHNVLNEAPHVTGDSIVYDYPLAEIYLDMANALYYVGSYPQSAMYCQKYGEYLTDSVTVVIESSLCNARALMKQQRYVEARDTATKTLSLALQSDLTYEAINSYVFLAKVYLLDQNPEMAARFALQGIEYGKKTGMWGIADKVYLYYIASAANARQGVIDKAEHYYELLLISLADENRFPALERQRVNAQIELAKATQDYESLASAYEDLLELRESADAQSASWEDFAAIAKALDDRELALVKAQAELNAAQSNNMTTLALFTTAISAIVLIAFWRIYRQKKQIELHSQLDPLTGVTNRWHAINRIRKRLARVRKHSAPCCVAILDLDHFRQINTRFGYDVGDQCLIQFARAARYQLGADDVFGRYGGEEFIILLENTGRDEAQQRLNALRELAKQIQVKGLPDDVTLRFSAGLIEVHQRTTTGKVIPACDALLREAKQQGRNQVKVALYSLSSSGLA